MRTWRVIINEQHKLLPDQSRALDEALGAGAWTVQTVPAAGLTLAEIDAMARAIPCGVGLVMASPIPALMVLAAWWGRKVRCLHNDKRDKVETPDGRITMRVAADGWVVV